MAWLAAIIDGEGSITVQVVTKSDGSIRLTPFVAINNTDEGILAKCRRILDSVGVGHQTHQHGVGSGFESRLPCWLLRVNAGKRLKVLLPLLLPHLASVKHGYAEKVLEFIRLREIGLFEHDASGRIRRREYNRAEIQLISEVRTHSRAKSLASMLAAPNVVQ